jgi:uncharacterized tellurite resistance protein B-like protein
MQDFDYNSFECSILILLYAIYADEKRHYGEIEKLKDLSIRIEDFCPSKTLKMPEITMLYEKLKNKNDSIKQSNFLNTLLAKIDDNFLRLELLKSMSQIFYSDDEYHDKENEFIKKVSSFWNIK